MTAGKGFRKRCREKEQSPEWTLEKIREACEKVAKGRNWTLGHCAGIFEERYGLLEEDHCASRWKGRSHFVVYLPASLGGPHLVCVDRTRRLQQEEEALWWCAVCGGKYERRPPSRILLMQLDTNKEEAKVFRAHAAPQRLFENLINALKLLANQQRDGDSPIQNIVTGLREKG